MLKFLFMIVMLVVFFFMIYMDHDLYSSWKLSFPMQICDLAIYLDHYTDHVSFKYVNYPVSEMLISQQISSK